jgi:hypothetical protein
MLKPKSPQDSFYGSYLYDRIVPKDHLLRKINAVVDFSSIKDLVKDRYTPDFGRPAEDYKKQYSLVCNSIHSQRLYKCMMSQLLPRTGIGFNTGEPPGNNGIRSGIGRLLCIPIPLSGPYGCSMGMKRIK